MAVPAEDALEFGGFRLDVASGRLLRGGHPVALPPKAFALLHYLAARPGRLVPKQELLAALWPDVFVGDAVLKVTIRDVRRALGDDPQTPTFIETAHRRGYRFIAEVRTAGAAPTEPIPVPPVHYARSGDVSLAYQVVGDGPLDVVFVMGWVSHLEYFWKEPSFARFLMRLASFSRLILFDKRGTGLSDPVPVHQLPTLEQRLDDVRAVMDAAGSERAALVGVSEGGPLCTLFAATYPEKTESIVMIGSYARRFAAPDYPWGQAPDESAAFCRHIRDAWGGPVGLDIRAPSRLGDPAFREWWAAYLRMGASPGAAVALTEMNAQIDVRDVLPTLRVPALIVHRTGDRCLPVRGARYLASQIPGAEYVELPGEDHLPFVGDQDTLLAEVEAFLTRAHVRSPAVHTLASVLVAATRTTNRAGTLARAFARQVTEHRGNLLDAPDGILAAAFDGPARAVRCGLAIAGVGDGDPILRLAVHVGELNPAAPAALVAATAAIAATATPGVVVVSQTVVDLVPGSGLAFRRSGSVRPPEVDRELAVYAAGVEEIGQRRDGTA